ncbi:MAG TPA: molecular chaperone DnaJ [Cyanobacteria bacterium UBA11049]|nr:molecular chaperone DnaJ [Cyanobacteria bacterium UBA11049]
MRIPLDYYRILGLPIQTSAEQLQQAYRDRTVQLPQREYSAAAIEARNQLIAAAYAVLSDPEQRQRYDASYFASTYEVETNNDSESTAIEHTLLPSSAFEPNTPSIEIADDLFVGALLMLQELGEYELVLDNGLSFLSTNSITQKQEQIGDRIVRSDVVLTVALAYLELGREQWQQGQYENAATSLEFGQKLLAREGLFPVVAGDIQADLDKLRPYRILELLAQPEANIAARQQGLILLQAILEERKGIDGTGNDGSGLSVEDFLRFIQQLRSYLSAAEQQSLFEAESQRPSAVATYLAVYALIARGFAERLPVLIRQAKVMLVRLGKRQDLYLEQAICSLLLGQTIQASRDLELSQEYEPLAFIRENSQGSPDLLPGLCLYSENWLQKEVFPNFRDLADRQASLKEYFADEQVQAYLEALPTELEAAEDWKVDSDSPRVGGDAEANDAYETNQQLAASRSQNSLPPSQKLKTRTTTAKERAIATPRREARATRHEKEFDLPQKDRSSPLNGIAVLPETERPERASTNSSVDWVGKEQSPPRSRRRAKNRSSRKANGRDRKEPLFHSQDNDVVWASSDRRVVKKNRLILLLASSVLGIVVLWFLASFAAGLFKRISTPAPVASAQLMVELNQPAVPIPKPAKKPPSAAQTLNQATATQVIQSWLSTKSAAFGQNHAVDQLGQILAEPALSQWQQRARNDKASNRTRQYKHSIKINSIQTKASLPEQAQLVATVNEIAQVYEKGRLNRQASYNETLQVRYDLVRQGDRWLILAMKVLK